MIVIPNDITFIEHFNVSTYEITVDILDYGYNESDSNIAIKPDLILANATIDILNKIMTINEPYEINIRFEDNEIVTEDETKPLRRLRPRRNLQKPAR